MKILSLDSTALTATTALCDDDKLIAEFSVNRGNTHSETLLPMISDMLEKCGVTARDIDIFSCSAGPGSFTGVRIGAATIKGLAFGTAKPCIGVSTLRALAYNLRGFDGVICPVMNARRGQVYNALFGSDGKRLCDDRAVSIPELYEELKEENKRILLCGDGTDITYDVFFEDPNILRAPERLRYQSGFSVAQCALEDYRQGVRTSDVELTPVYLRLSQAERERLAKESGSLENLENK